MINRFRKGEFEPKPFGIGLVVGTVLGVITGVLIVGLF